MLRYQLWFDILREKKIDLVILDLNLGRKSGADILVDIKKNHPEQKVIMFTGETLGPFEKVLLERGALCCLPKDIGLLARTIQEILKK